jgi:hypothetical protein
LGGFLSKTKFPTQIKKAPDYGRYQELSALNNLVEQYLIFAEGQAMKRIPMKMKDWINKLEGFLTINDRDILQDKGKVSHEKAIEIAEKEYCKFNKKRINQSSQIDDDFDRTIKLIDNRKKK